MYGASGIVDYVAALYLRRLTHFSSLKTEHNLIMRSTPIAFSVYGKYWVNNQRRTF